MTKLLEIGPGLFPAREYIMKVRPTNVTFVTESRQRRNLTNYDEVFPGCEVYSLGFLRFIAEIAIPRGYLYDHVVACNVLNDPGTTLSPRELAVGVKSVLAEGGVFRVENTIDQVSSRVANIYMGALSSFGFQTVIYTSENPEEFVNSILVKANRDGFSIKATQ